MSHAHVDLKNFLDSNLTSFWSTYAASTDQPSATRQKAITAWAWVRPSLDSFLSCTLTPPRHDSSPKPCLLSATRLRSHSSTGWSPCLEMTRSGGTPGARWGYL